MQVINNPCSDLHAHESTCPSLEHWRIMEAPEPWFAISAIRVLSYHDDNVQEQAFFATLFS